MRIGGARRAGAVAGVGGGEAVAVSHWWGERVKGWSTRQRERQREGGAFL